MRKLFYGIETESNCSDLVARPDVDIVAITRCPVSAAVNAISTVWEPGVGYSDVSAGSSFVMVTSFKKGSRCPKDRSILTYSLSENPNSKHYADQTRMFSRKEWVNPPFCADEVKSTAKSVKVVSGK